MRSAGELRSERWSTSTSRAATSRHAGRHTVPWPLAWSIRRRQRMDQKCGSRVSNKSVSQECRSRVSMQVQRPRRAVPKRPEFGRVGQCREASEPLQQSSQHQRAPTFRKPQVRPRVRTQAYTVLTNASCGIPSRAKIGFTSAKKRRPSSTYPAVGARSGRNVEK